MIVKTAGPLLLLLLDATAFLCAMAYVQSVVANLTWNSVAHGLNRFQSTLRMKDMLVLYLTNAMAIVVSLGLLIPWASIRLARYRAEHLALLAAFDLGGFVAGAKEQAGGAAGEEVAEFMDFDVGL